MNNSEDKFIQSKCREMLREYEDVLKYVIDREEKELKILDIDAETDFEFVKKSFLNKGILEGMKRILAKINSIAQQ